MGEETDLLFNVPLGTSFWTLEEHEPLIIVLFLPIIYIRNWRGPWKVKVSK